MKEGSKITIADNKEKNNGGKTATFKENDTIEIPSIFPPKLLTQIVFLSPAL